MPFVSSLASAASRSGARRWRSSHALTYTYDDRFFQLARALGWEAHTGILMLWAYFDESGIHAPDGSLTKLTVGGMIASFESWERLSSRWSRRALAAMDLPYFHMAHFQARKPPYSNWTEEERRDRLNTLLEIIGEPDRHGLRFHQHCARRGHYSLAL